MIRIQIKWTDKLLSLGACAGDLTISRGSPIGGHKFDVILTARVKVERYSLGYSNIKWADDTLTTVEYENFLKPTLDAMVKSYHDGMLLENQSYQWIEDWKEKND